LALAVLAVMTACSGGNSAAELIAAAPAAAARRGSARIELVSTVIFSGSGQAFSTTTKAAGVSEFTGARRSHLTMTLTTNPAGGPKLVPCEMVAQGALVYVKLPPAKRTTAKSWLSIDVAKIAGLDPGAMSTDPYAQIDYLKSANATVKKVGTDVIRGTKTTHYRYTAKVSDLGAKLPAKARAQITSALKSLNITSFPVDTWIDDSGLPRRMAFDWKTTKSGATLDISTTIDTYDYGTSAAVALPSAADVQASTEPANAFSECFGAPTGSLAGMGQK
jgi:hypothetical protein